MYYLYLHFKTKIIFKGSLNNVIGYLLTFINIIMDPSKKNQYYNGTGGHTFSTFQIIKRLGNGCVYLFSFLKDGCVYLVGRLLF